MLSGFWGLVVIMALLLGLIAWCLARLESIRQEKQRRHLENMARSHPKVWCDGRWISVASGRRR